MKLSNKLFIISGVLVLAALVASEEFFVPLIVIAIVCGIIGLVKMGENNGK